MDKIKIITDSTCDLEESITKKYDIEVLPLNICFGNDCFLDTVQINLKQMFERIKSTSVIPKTSQVNPQKFIDTYKNYLNKGFKIISIHLSSKMSGTYNSALVAKESLGNDENIEIIDTNNITAGLGILVIEAAKNIINGFGFSDTLSKIKDMIPNIRNIIVLDTFENLVKGGRLNKAVGMIGSIFDIKPILEMKDGIPVLKDKVRGIKKATRYLLDFVDNINVDKLLNLILIDSLNSEMKPHVKAKLIEKGINFIESTIGCAVGTHVGEKGCAIFYLERNS